MANPRSTAQKLGAVGQSVFLVEEDPDFFADELSESLTSRSDRAELADVVIVFCRSASVLTEHLDELSQAIFPDRALWIAWPRRAAGHESDMTDESVRAAVLATGLVDVKVAALGEHGSGLKFVWRREHRGKRTPR